MTVVQEDVRLVSQVVQLSNGQGSIQLPVTAEELALQQLGGLTGVPTINLNIAGMGDGSTSIFSVASLINSSLWPSPSSPSTGSTSGAAGQLLSGIVAVVLKNSSYINYNSSFIEISFVGAVKVYNTSSALNFTITCPPRFIVTKSYTCNDTGYVETFQCKGVAGKYQGTCPVLTQTCAALDLNSLTVASDNVCQTINVNTTTSGVPATGIVCRCGIGGAGFIDGSGSVAAGVVLSLVGADLSKTFQASTAFGDGSAASKAAVVLSLFCGIWGFATVIIIYFGYGRLLWSSQRQSKNQKADTGHMESKNNLEGFLLRAGLFLRKSEDQNNRTRKVIQTPGSDVLNSNVEHSNNPSNKQRLLEQYLTFLFPTVFLSTSFLEGFFKELWRNHQFLNFFFRLHRSLHPVLDVVKVVTMQGFLLFLLAFLYDLNYPSDDGSCVLHLSESDCLQRKFIFDPSKTYCTWQAVTYVLVDDDSVYYECVFADPKFSFTTAMYVSMMISFATCIFMDPLEYLICLLGSPALSRSTVSESRSKSGPISDNSFAAPEGVHGMETDIEKSSFPRETEATNMAFDHSQPSGAKRTLVNLSFHRQLPFSSLLKSEILLGLNLSIPNAVFHGIRNMEQLEYALQSCRKLLIAAQYSDVAGFDRVWCLDSSNGQFLSLTSTKSDAPMFSMYSVVAEEQDKVQRTARLLTAELSEVESREEIGFEIMVQFIQDLLGGNESAAARIFSMKMELEYEKVLRITLWVKVLIVMFIIGLNGFFFYFTLLRAISKGLIWQRSYLLAWLLQVILDVFLFETLQCAWFHYFLPSLAKEEVCEAKRVVEQVFRDLTQSGESIGKVNAGGSGKSNKIPRTLTPIAPLLSLANSPNPQQVAMAEKKIAPLDNAVLCKVLNAPDFLFVSTHVAAKFPNLLESQVVRSYRTIWPGKAGDRWREVWRKKVKFYKTLNGAQEELSNTPNKPIQFLSLLVAAYNWPKRFVLSLVMKLVIMAPLQVQSVVIRVAEPVLFSGVVFFCLFLYNYPDYISIVCICVAVWVATSWRNEIRSLFMTKKVRVDTAAVQPSQDNDNAPQEGQPPSMPLGYSMSSFGFSGSESSGGSSATGDGTSFAGNNGVKEDSDCASDASMFAFLSSLAMTAAEAKSSDASYSTDCAESDKFQDGEDDAAPPTVGYEVDGYDNNEYDYYYNCGDDRWPRSGDIADNDYEDEDEVEEDNEVVEDEDKVADEEEDEYDYGTHHSSSNGPSSISLYSLLHESPSDSEAEQLVRRRAFHLSDIFSSASSNTSLGSNRSSRYNSECDGSDFETE